MRCFRYKVLTHPKYLIKSSVFNLVIALSQKSYENCDHKVVIIIYYIVHVRKQILRR